MPSSNIFQIFAEAQVSDASFVQSLLTVVIFLSILAAGGYIIVRFCKYGGFTRDCSAVDETKKIRILDNKILYGRKYITLVECAGKRLLILVNRDNAVKLSEWEIGANEVDR
ncbi:MAG: flagellar biosynthetic protein FliO [Puniceicoccales bacterium]|nr:flagellar biosynthetic protein FliO [Puniceicoccales bacterium]